MSPILLLIFEATKSERPHRRGNEGYKHTAIASKLTSVPELLLSAIFKFHGRVQGSSKTAETFRTDLTKTKEKEHMVTNRLTLNRQEERGCPETVVAPTVHLLIALLVA